MGLIYTRKQDESAKPGTFVVETLLTSDRIRLACREDYEVLKAIYAPYILETTVTFEYEVPSSHEFAMRMDAISRTYPILVYERNHQIIGYAYAAVFKPRTAYQWTAETVIYLQHGFVGEGIGRRLYAALFDILRMQGVYQGIAVITSENDISIGFHRKTGFEPCAKLKRVGYKFGRWLDVDWMQLTFADLPSDPEPVLSVEDIACTPEFAALMERINADI